MSSTIQCQKPAPPVYQPPQKSPDHWPPTGRLRFIDIGFAIKPSLLIHLGALCRQACTGEGFLTLLAPAGVIEVWLTIGALYVAIGWPLSLFFRRLERRTGRG